MAAAGCVHDLRVVSVNTLVSGAVGYGAFLVGPSINPLLTGINPVLGATMGLVDTLIRAIAGNLFMTVERQMRNANCPKIAELVHDLNNWMTVAVFTLVCGLGLGSLFSVEAAALLLLSQVASIFCSTIINACI